MAIALRCESAEARRYAAGVRKDARRLMRLLDLQYCELSIVIADDAFVHALNREFRGKDRPTDVLSFPQWEHDDAAPLAAATAQPAQAAAPLGDVVISVDTARRQARRLGVAPAARIRTLLVHGMLHLLGYDHERSPAEARRMFARERELAAALADMRASAGRGRRTRAGSGAGCAGQCRRVRGASSAAPADRR